MNTSGFHTGDGVFQCFIGRNYSLESPYRDLDFVAVANTSNSARDDIFKPAFEDLSFVPFISLTRTLPLLTYQHIAWVVYDKD